MAAVMMKVCYAPDVLCFRSPKHAPRLRRPRPVRPPRRRSYQNPKPSQARHQLPLLDVPPRRHRLARHSRHGPRNPAWTSSQLSLAVPPWTGVTRPPEGKRERGNFYTFFSFQRLRSTRFIVMWLTVVHLSGRLWISSKLGPMPQLRP